MKSLWCDSEAKRFVASYRRKGVNQDLALRVYTTRLLGSDPRLVLHGGGNTSVKTRMRDLNGELIDVLCVKGSGWDMGAIEPDGLPALRVEQLQKLRQLGRLSDEDMINAQRGALLNSKSPNPSVETLLHAFLPHKFIDHTHSTAVLAITNQPNGEELVREVWGQTVGIVPYVMPGFDLAKRAAEIYESHPEVEGLILIKHGIFSLGKTAKETYKRMIKLVTLAEKRLARGRRKPSTSIRLPVKLASVSEVAPILRGVLASKFTNGDHQRWILDYRTNMKIKHYINGSDLGSYSQRGVVTPDHTIRTKNIPMLVAVPDAKNLSSFALNCSKARSEFANASHRYFARHNGKRDSTKVELDTTPRVILVPGLGLFGVGKSKKDAGIAADIAENTIAVIRDAEAIGKFEPLPEADLFDMEYWSLEQAKIGKEPEAALARQVVIVTGGASGIGLATAKHFATEGAHVAVLDLKIADAKKIAVQLGHSGLVLGCDVTDAKAVRGAFDAVCKHFGGVDIVVSNAGGAWQGKIAEVSERHLRQSFELNFFSHQIVAQNAVRVMRAQSTGGALLFNTSKQAINPGINFGPYGLPKAATLFLMKQYALEHGEGGITSNAVNADRVNTGIFKGGLLQERAKARGLTVDQYLSGGNLLRREVTVDDVAKAFVALAKSRVTTAAVITVDGGNIAASMR